MAGNNTRSTKGFISGAIDVMYFPPARKSSTPAAADPPCHEPIGRAITLKEECGLHYVFITPCKRWSCDRRIYCEDTHLDDILRYTQPHPEHFIGIGAFNPLEIGDSIHEIESGVKHHGFRGIYVHPGSFGISMSDRRMYPLYVKAMEWQVPVILDVRPLAGDVHQPRISELTQVAADFPELPLVVAQAPWATQELLAVLEDWANVYVCFDSEMLLSNAARQLLNSPLGAGRCIWGSNGLPWKEALGDVLSAHPVNASAIVRDNAAQLFRLNHLRKRKSKAFVESEEAPSRIVAE